MKATEFLQLAPSAPAETLYLLTGADAYLHRACLQALTQRVAPEVSLRPFNVSEHNLEQESLSRVLAVARELPVPPGRRLVVIRNLDKLTDAEVELLKDYVRHPTPTTTLVFQMDGLDKRRTATTVLLKTATLVECVALTPEEARRWVSGEARRRGYEFPAATVSRLIGAVGCDLARLTQEMEKLMHYAGAGGYVPPEAVEALVVRSLHEDNFALSEALWQGDAPRALRILHRLLGRGEEPVALVGLLDWQLRQMLTASELMAANTPRDVLVRELRMPPHRLNAFLGTVRKQSPTKWRHALIRLQAVDDAIKHGRATPRLLLEVFLCETLARVDARSSC